VTLRSLFLLDPTAWNDWKDWLGSHGVRILAILVVVAILEIAFRRIIGRWFRSALASAARVRREDPAQVKRRADSLVSTINWAFGLFLAFLTAGFVLAEVGLNVSALIAGVGVVGIALGLGAQTLVKDVINGMFILIEDQYAVGDIVSVAGATGQVIEINPRRTVIRDGDGNVHSIPNSAISVAVNKTASLNRFRVDLDVDFRDGDRASELAGEVCKELAHDIASSLIAHPSVVAQSVTSTGDVRLQIAGDAYAPQRWSVETELRRRLQRRFDAERIDARFELDLAGTRAPG
jgi:moderate conductance mechanosensitive channel